MPAISIQSLSKIYPSRGNAAEVRALDNVSFDIEQGEFFGLLGPNGAGKTTLISILAGLTQATHGTIKVHGLDVRGDYAQVRRYLGIVPQELVFDPFFTVREALRFQSGYFGIYNNGAWIDELLAGRDPATVVHQCGSGVSATPNVLAMRIAGFAPTALFAGSWSEWSRRPELPESLALVLALTLLMVGCGSQTPDTPVTPVNPGTEQTDPQDKPDTPESPEEPEEPEEPFIPPPPPPRGRWSAAGIAGTVLVVLPA